MKLDLIIDETPYSFRATNAVELADNLAWCCRDAGAPDGVFADLYEAMLRVMLELRGPLSLRREL